MKKIVCSLLMVSMLLVTVVGAACTGTVEPPTTPVKLVLVQGNEPPNLSWPEVGSLSMYVPLTAVYEPLTKRDPETLEVIPGLATSWEQVNPTTWRFDLREGVEFHNGEELTAEDVAATVLWAIEIESVLLDYLPVEDAVVQSTYVVDIITPGVDPQFPYRTSFLFVYPVAIARDDRELAASDAIGTGPYELLEWRRGDKMVFSYFTDYWGEEPEAEELELLFRDEESVRVAMLQTGEADWAFPIGPENVTEVPQAIRRPGIDTWMLRLDTAITENPILADKNLRLAINYAIDRELLIDTLYGGLASPAMGQRGNEACFGWDPDLEDYPYDLEMAQTLVEDAGAVGQTITWVGTSGTWPKDREMNEALAQMVEQTGLEVEIVFPEFSEYLDYIFTYTEETRAVMADVLGIASGTETLDNAQGRSYLAEGGATNAVEDPTLNDLWDEYDAATTVNGKLLKLQEISRYVQEEALLIWILKPDYTWGVSTDLEWTPSPEGLPFPASMRLG